MPKNCSSDVSLVIEHIDSVLLNGTDSEIFSLKQSFGLEDLEHNDDFAAALQNGPWLFQGNQFYRNTFVIAIQSSRIPLIVSSLQGLL
jgi:c-di-GMP-related signal transduction protein